MDGTKMDEHLKNIHAALDGGDVEKLDAAIAAFERAERLEHLNELIQVRRQVREHERLHAAVTLWFERAEAQHDASVGTEAKGDLLRWSDVGHRGLRLPTIRRDLADAARAGKLHVRGQELRCFVAERLDADARVWLLRALDTVEAAAGSAKDRAFATSQG